MLVDAAPKRHRGRASRPAVLVDASFGDQEMRQSQLIVRLWDRKAGGLDKSTSTFVFVCVCVCCVFVCLCAR